MGTQWTEAQINRQYKEMFHSGRWDATTLQEAMRQSWIAMYLERATPAERRNRQQVSGDTLQDLQERLANPGVKFIKRRVVKDTEPV